MKKVILFSFFLSLIMFFSCTKEVNKSEDNNLSNSRVGNLNPYDFVGQDHNSSLDYLAAKVDIFDMDQMQRITYIREFYTNKYPNIAFDTPLEMKNFLDSNYVEGESIYNISAYYHSIGEMTDIQFKYFAKLDSVSIISDINQFNTEISLMEEELSQDNSLTDDEKGWIWGAISVCYHSKNYRHSARTDPNHPWHSLLSLKSSGTKDKDPDYTGTWIGEAWADTRGFIRGFFRKKYNQGRWHNASNGGSNTTAQYIDAHTVK